jgi:hypothetical protein
MSVSLPTILCLVVQLWALEEGGALIVGARSSKAKETLPTDLDYIFDKLPEYLPSE